MLPIIIIILSSLVLVFSILRKKSNVEKNIVESNLSEFYNLPDSATQQTKMRILQESAIKNLYQREDCFNKSYMIQQLSNQRLLSMKHWQNLIAKKKELEYEKLIIESEAENLKNNWPIFSDANKLLPMYKKREEKVDKDTINKENTFLTRKKMTLEHSLINKLKNENAKI